MPIDKIDQRLLDASGNAQDIMYELYGKKIGQNNAEKQLAGARTHVNYKAKLDDGRDIGEMEETIVKADGSITTKRMLLLSETDSKDPKKIMELMGYDPLQWKVKWCKTRRNYWDVTIKNTAKEGVKHTNHAYMCELTVEPIQGAITTADVEKVFDKLEAPKLVQYKYKKPSSKLFELPIMDLHLGKLSWKKESGDDYDIKIAEALYRKTIEDFLNNINVLGLNISQIVFPIGQDFFHFDTSKNTTTKGTIMDTDTRWPKMYEKGVELTLWAIENLRAIAPVDVIYVASNHDKMMSFFLTKHIDAWFRKINTVSVNTAPYPRKYIQWGKCLIGYSHGSEESKRIDILMQQECPFWTNKTQQWREWHLGHLHSEYAREIGGIIIRRVSSITSRDQWHTDHGYQAVRKAQAFVWDKSLGKILTIDSNVMV